MGSATQYSYHIHFHFSKSTHDQQYFICDNPVSTDQNIKDLGILFTSSLQWDLHYKSIISKANEKCSTH